MPLLGGLPYVAVVYRFVLHIFSGEVSHSQCETDFKNGDGTFNQQADTFGELSNLIEQTQYVNITGSTLFKDETGHNIAPATFLMTGEAVTASPATFGNYTNCIDLTSFNEPDLNLTVALERAAAKMTFNFTIKENSGHIHSFGNPLEATFYTNLNIEYVDIGTIQDSELNYSQASYYLRNMTYGTTYFGENSTLRRKTNPVPYTDGGYMTCAPRSVSVTVYVYSCSWGGVGSDAFTDAPFLIVNLPLVEKITGTSIEDGNGNTISSVGKYLERNYYEIPLRLRTDSQKANIERNHHYILNATIDAPGGITSMEPFPIVPVSYYVYPWNEESINVGGNTEDVNYLNLSTNYIEMHNTTTDASIKFASSSAVTVTKTDAYYINKSGERITDNTANITATASTGMNGKITVNSPVPTNDAVRYMTFKVSNGTTAYDKTFTVAQYPLLYIFNTVGWYSYRDDVKNDSGEITHYQNRKNNNVTQSKDGFDFRIYDNPNYTIFGAVLGKAGYDIYIYSDNGANIYTLNGWKFQKWGGLIGSDQTNELENPRMYHVNVAATSNQYVLGKPLTDNEGACIESVENAKLVSPSFMIASQLGTLNGDSNMNKSAYEKGKIHCQNYVEVYLDNNKDTVQLRNWRLPTKAEIQIIAAHQDGEAMDKLLIGENYICITGSEPSQQYTTVNSNVGDKWKGYYTRCVRDAYDDKTPKH